MIAAWMLYSAIWGLWISAIAWGTERVMLGGRGPARFVWLAAIVLSIAAPAVAYLGPRDVTYRVEGPSVVLTSVSRDVRSGRNTGLVHRVETRTSIPTIATVAAAASRANRPLGLAWLVLSLGVLAYLAGGALRLRMLRRNWHVRVVEGTRVLVSDDIGPALVGVVRGTIVVPIWALSLEREALALMLRHEEEHRAAGDTRALALAETLLALMPWNPALWWQVRRLRLAVEMDCDARVLRGATDVAAYGRLLLEFGGGSRAMRFAGVALAGHASNLEMRIRRMTERAGMTRARAVALSLVAGAMAIAIGCQVPAPPSPSPASAPPAPTATPAPVADARRSDTVRRIRLADTLVGSLAPQFDSLDARERRDRAAFKSLVDRQPSDSAARAMFDRQIETMKSLDSASATLKQLRQFLTDDHPQVVRLKEQLKELAQQTEVLAFSDSALALSAHPGCTAGYSSTGDAVVKLLVADQDAPRGGRIVVSSEPSTGSGTTIEYDRPGMSCATVGGGEIRVFGRDAFKQMPVFVQTGVRASVVVVTGSGRVLAGPISIQNEARTHELTWAPR